MRAALSVWWDGKRVGTLRLDDHGDMSFAYAPDWLSDPAAAPLSASLPKQAETFRRRACRPFFGGLLPEEGQREAVARALGISSNNDFALLSAAVVRVLLDLFVGFAMRVMPPSPLRSSC